jgi:hypothetical protein
MEVLLRVLGASVALTPPSQASSAPQSPKLITSAQYTRQRYIIYRKEYIDRQPANSLVKVPPGTRVGSTDRGTDEPLSCRSALVGH